MHLCTFILHMYRFPKNSYVDVTSAHYTSVHLENGDGQAKIDWKKTYLNKNDYKRAVHKHIMH